MRPITRYEQIELLIPTGSTATKFNFPDMPQLRSDVTKDVIIRGIEAFTIEAMPLDFNNNALPPLAELKKASLTLYINGEESIFRLPVIKLVNTYSDNSAAPANWYAEINQFSNIQVDWTKSYISTPVAFASTPWAFCFGITYMRLAPGTMQQIYNSSGRNGNCDTVQMM